MKQIVKLFCFFASFFLTLQVFAVDLQYKISDGIAPFFDEQDEVLHNSGIPFYQIDIQTAPYIDEKQLNESFERYKVYLKRIKEAGYTHISLDDINHLLTLDDTGIYRNNIKIYRHSYYKQYYKKLIKEARKYGIGVFLVSDMQFYTKEIEKKFGLDPESEKLKQFNQIAFEEILSDMNGIEGVILRFGEGGKAYNTAHYKSSIIYKTPQQIASAIDNILPLFEKYDKKLIIRTWTIGVGDVGDLSINPETYDAIFSSFDTEHLIASIKHTPGDFFDFFDENPTIGRGNIPQIIEIQIRREYEGAGEFPNFFIQEYQNIIESITQHNQVVGVWNWNQTGGWGWGKNMLFNYGFNFWNEVNFRGVGQVLVGETDSDKIISFILEKLSGKYEFTQEEKNVLKEIILSSRNIIKKGWYLKEFQEKQYYISGIRIPPLLYIWWDRPTSSPLVLSLIAQNVSSPYTQNILNTLEHNSLLWEQVSSDTNYKKDISFSLENQRMIFEILFLYQEDFLNYYKGNSVKNTETVLGKIQEHMNFLEGNRKFTFDWTEVYRFYRQDFTYQYMSSYILGLITLILACLLIGGFIFALSKLWYKKRKTYKYFLKQKLIIDTKKTIYTYMFVAELCFFGLIFMFLREVYVWKVLVYLFYMGAWAYSIIIIFCLGNIFLAYMLCVDIEEKIGDRYIGKNEKIFFGVVFGCISFICVYTFIFPQIEKYFYNQLPTYFYEAGSDIEKFL